MEQFIVSARKYRPQIFEDVVGQQAITNTLENAIKSNHLAQALLFTGPRGVGKTTCARILAKRINQKDLEQIDPDEDFSFNIFELDAASNNSVDDIRNLTDQVRIPPQTGNYKVYIIDEVHMLSQAAFNAFLKTLEEPPAHAIFILATTEKHKIIPTILSRCQIFDFKRIGVLDIKNYLIKIAKIQGIDAEDDALHIIAQKADGALRDALSTFDRVVSFTGAKLTRLAVIENLNVLDYEVYFNTTDLILKHNIPQLFLAFNTVLDKGFEGHHFITGLASHFRDILVAKDAATVNLLEVGDGAKELYLNQAKACDVPFLLKAIELANTCDLNYKTSKNQRLLVELTLMQLASINFDSNLLDEKKKSKPFIIPATFYKESVSEKDIILEKNFEEPKENYAVPNKEEPASKPTDSQKDKISNKIDIKAPVLKKPILNIPKRSGSALSLKSLISKEKTINTATNDTKQKDLPRTPFTEDQFFKIWNMHLEHLDVIGEKIMLSILNSNKPQIKDDIIKVTFPNKGMQISFNKGKTPLLERLRKELNNYKIDFKVIVNKAATKEYIYTSQEKYIALKEKNPNIEILKKTFKLDL
ncbi:MAG: DNA polymerase III subunit gamma/tau [Flavobacteriales bacterium]|jgi:DNA polymerase III subunit gamma/tau|nr:DNA polymerase III subunit gamma/tau [Flavobacteriales bacterium]